MSFIKSLLKDSSSDKAPIDAPLRHFLDSHPKICIILRIIAIFIVFLSSLAVFSYIWVINNYYADITFDVVLFHLRFPLVGVNNAFVYSYVTRALIPSIFIAIFFAIRPQIALLVGLILSALLLKAQKIIKVSMIVAWNQHNSLYEMLIIFIKGRYFKSFWWNEPFGAWFVLKAILWIGAICLFIFMLFWVGKWLCKAMNLYAQIALFFAVVTLNFWIIDSHFHLRQYLVPKEYGSFYDENYAITFSDSGVKDLSAKNADSAPPQERKNARNLIVIFAESMEANFAGKDFKNPSLRESRSDSKQSATTSSLRGVANAEAIQNKNIDCHDSTQCVESRNDSNENAIPNLYALANRHINFSTTEGFGGHLQVGRTSWTIAALVGYMCGIPLNATNSIIAKTFLPSARCISDILATHNYNQVMIMGSNDDFVAKGAFLSSHHIKSNDLKHYKDTGALPSDYSHQWGFEDSKLFAFAKDELLKLTQNRHCEDASPSSLRGVANAEAIHKSKIDCHDFATQNLAMTEGRGNSRPFALYLLTNNTHFPDSFVESFCENSDEISMQNALKCDDSLISEFIAWVKKQDFYENTTILIVGDHLMNANIPLPRESRRIYNAFINPRFCGDSHSTSSLRGVTNAEAIQKSQNRLPRFGYAESRNDEKWRGLPRQAKGLSRNDKLTKSRNLSHFDFAPLILDSLGICTKSFGLGRNPLLGQTLLETYSADFERYISEDSRLYDSFWQRR